MDNNLFKYTESITQTIENERQFNRQEPYQYRPSFSSEESQKNNIHTQDQTYRMNNISPTDSVYLFQEDIQKNHQGQNQLSQRVNKSQQQKSIINRDDKQSFDKKQKNDRSNPQIKLKNFVSAKYDDAVPKQQYNKMQQSAQLMKKKSQQIYKKYNLQKLNNNKLNEQLNKFKQQKKRIQIKYKKQYEDLKNQQIFIIQMEFQSIKQNMQLQIDNLKDDIKGYQKKIKKLQLQLKKLQQNSQFLKNDNEKKDQQIKKLKKSQQINLQKINQNEKYIQVKRKQIQNLKQQKQQYQKQINIKRKQLQQLQIKYYSLRRQKDALSIEITNKNNIIQKNQASIKNFKSELDKLTKTSTENLKKSQEKYKKLEENNKKIQDNSNKLQKQIEKHKNQNQKLKSQNKNLKLQLEKLTQKYKNQTDTLDRTQSQVQSLNQQKNSLNKLIKSIQTELTTFKNQFKNNKLQKLILKNNVKNIFQQLRFDLIKMKYFNDSIITAALNPRKTQFIVDTICKFLQFNSFKPVLVYRFDRLNTTNFHQYIDNRTNQTVIGGFTANPLNPQNIPKPGNGFIFNLTNQKLYKMRSEPRLPVHSYDIYYFILGNAQIRLRSQEQKVYSNFGIANSTFDNSGDLRTIFLKVNDSSNNELDILTYEFYEIKPE